MITHDPSNVNGLIDWTESINEIDNQFGFIRENVPFKIDPTSQTSIIFDKNTNTITLVPARNRKEGKSSVGKDKAVEQFAMILQHYPYEDYIDVDDVQGKRKPGSPDIEEALNSVRAEKLMDLKAGQDQTDEHLRFEAMVGNLPAGAVSGVSDMYALFGLNKAADYTIDLVTESDATDVDGKISQVKRAVASGFKTGSRIQGVDFFVDFALYDELKQHPQIRESYMHYQNSGKQLLRDDDSTYTEWGITDMFEHDGVRIMAYNPEFLQEDGSTVQVLGAGQGVAIPRNARDMFRGYWGPATKLSLANQPGQELFAFEYRSQDDESHTIETQATKLYWATKPAAIIHLT
jgi:hypothetical protein